MYEGPLEERLNDTDAESIVEALRLIDERKLKDIVQMLKDKGVEPWKNLQ
jgi:hypothetical protein